LPVNQNKGLAGVIQSLLTIVAQSLRRFGQAAGAGVGGRLGAEPAEDVAVAQRRSMAGI
jgi:hypothetical protein